MLRRVLIALAFSLAITPALAFPAAVQRQILDPRVSTIATNKGFTPANLGGALAAWWNADDLTPGVVTAWTDRQSSILLANVGTPSDSATGWTGYTGGAKAGVSCDGTTGAFVSILITGLPNGTTAGEIWSLAFVTSTTGVLVQYGGVTGGTFRVIRTSSAGRYQAGDGTTFATATAAVPQSNSLAAGVMGAQFSTASYSARANGYASPATAPSSLNTGTVRLRLCAGNNTVAANFVAAVLRHVLVTTALTAAQDAQTEGYLAWDGNVQTLLPFNHPFRFRKP